MKRHRATKTSPDLLEAEIRRAENLRLERGLLPRPVLHDPALTFETF